MAIGSLRSLLLDGRDTRPFPYSYSLAACFPKASTERQTDRDRDSNIDTEKQRERVKEVGEGGREVSSKLEITVFL